MSTRAWAKDLDNPTRAHLFWCLEWRNDIDQWRETLAANERAKLNHPTAMKRRYEAAHPEPRDAEPERGAKKEPPISRSSARTRIYGKRTSSSSAKSRMAPARCSISAAIRSTPSSTPSPVTCRSAGSKA